jgi:hypothetical protein
VHFYRCNFYRCGTRNFQRCFLTGHIVVSLFFVSLPSLATSPFPLCTPRSVCAFQFFFLKFVALSTGGCIIVLRLAGVPLPASVSLYLSTVTLRFSSRTRTRNSDKYEWWIAHTSFDTSLLGFVALRSPKHRRGESEKITRSRSPKHRRGESEWIGLRLMDSPTFSSTSHSACFGDVHASTSVHHDVYTGGSLLHIMHHFQVRTSTYGFLLSDILFGATFFI